MAYFNRARVVALMTLCAAMAAPANAHTAPNLPQPIVEWVRREPYFEISGLSYSPDGRSLVYVRRAHGPDGGEAEPPGNVPLDRWFRRHRRTNRWYGTGEVLLIRTSGSTPRHIAYGLRPAFSPDGKRIVFSRLVSPDPDGVSRPTPLAVYNLATARMRTLPAPPGTSFECRGFSPDGRRAYVIISYITGEFATEHESIAELDLGFMALHRVLALQKGHAVESILTCRGVPYVVDSSSLGNYNELTSIRMLNRHGTVAWQQIAEDHVPQFSCSPRADGRLLICQAGLAPMRMDVTQPTTWTLLDPRTRKTERLPWKLNLVMDESTVIGPKGLVILALLRIQDYDETKSLYSNPYGHTLMRAIPAGQHKPIWFWKSVAEIEEYLPESPIAWSPDGKHLALVRRFFDRNKDRFIRSEILMLRLPNRQLHSVPHRPKVPASAGTRP